MFRGASYLCRGLVRSPVTMQVVVIDGHNERKGRRGYVRYRWHRLRGADEVPPVGQLTAMAWAMAHRGPDDQGLYRQPGIGLCFRRLSIIDRRADTNP
ncbi:hypothetical protein [Neomoorella thermoacetica]|uniref:hypothetical protein n=1 Tax=Neomoorella thermoacetica TaxID=1525 RepID=UPI0030D43ED9